MNIVSTVLHINIAKASEGRYIAHYYSHKDSGSGGGSGGGGGCATPMILESETELKTWLAALSAQVS